MEEIIGLLVALAVLIFKVVGKRLENSGAPSAENMDGPAGEPAESPLDVRKWLEEVVTEVKVMDEPESVRPVEEAPRAVFRPTAVEDKRNVKAASPAAVEEAQKVSEKIDPKKLVVYSEIMKPKFKEEN